MSDFFRANTYKVSFTIIFTALTLGLGFFLMIGLIFGGGEKLFYGLGFLYPAWILDQEFFMNIRQYDWLRWLVAFVIQIIYSYLISCFIDKLRSKKSGFKDGEGV